MNILIVTNSDRSFGLAHRLSIEGNTVEVYCPSKSYGKTGAGIWKMITNLKEGIKNCQFIIADSEMPLDSFNFAKMFNKPVVGWHPLTDLLNLSSVKEFEAGNACGCSYPYTEVFDDATDAGELIIGWDLDRYYIKHDRRSINLNYSEWLSWAMYNLPYGEPVLIQEAITGQDVSVIGWFDGMDWRKPFLLCNSDSAALGASILWRDDRNIATHTIEPLARFLKSVGYRGPVKCSLKLTDDLAYLIKVNVGFTYPDLYAFVEGCKEPIGSFLWSIAIGRMYDLRYTNDYAVAFEASVKEADMQGAPLTGVEDANLRHSTLHDVYKEGQSYFIANGHSHCYTAMARGDAVEVATGRAYRTIQLLTFPCMGYPSNMRFHFSMLVDRVTPRTL